jgi:hypothetical protein
MLMAKGSFESTCQLATVATTIPICIYAYFPTAGANFNYLAKILCAGLDARLRIGRLSADSWNCILERACLDGALFSFVGVHESFR